MSVRHALLALLSDGSRYGLQLQHAFEERTGAVWPLNVGQVYTTLQRLERDGLVTSAVDRQAGTQKVYRITDAGAVELERWLRTPPGASPPPRAELVIKVLVATQVPGVNVHEVIQTHQRHVIELIQQMHRLKRHGAAQQANRALVIDAELLRLDSVVRWLSIAESHLRRPPPEGPRQPPSSRTATGRPGRPLSDRDVSDDLSP
jgi:DNA-binding PadR family transcriptional regulator